MRLIKVQIFGTIDGAIDGVIDGIIGGVIEPAEVF